MTVKLINFFIYHEELRYWLFQRRATPVLIAN